MSQNTKLHKTNDMSVIETTVPNDVDDRYTLSYPEAQIAVGSIPEERLRQVHQILCSYRDSSEELENKRVTISFDNEEIIKFYGKIQLSKHIERLQDRLYLYEFVSEMEVESENDEQRTHLDTRKYLEDMISEMNVDTEKEGE